jgi:hypothetical protein
MTIPASADIVDVSLSGIFGGSGTLMAFPCAPGPGCMLTSEPFDFGESVNSLGMFSTSETTTLSSLFGLASVVGQVNGNAEATNSEFTVSATDSASFTTMGSGSGANGLLDDLFTVSFTLASESLLDLTIANSFPTLSSITLKDSMGNAISLPATGPLMLGPGVYQLTSEQVGKVFAFANSMNSFSDNVTVEADFTPIPEPVVVFTVPAMLIGTAFLKRRLWYPPISN